MEPHSTVLTEAEEAAIVAFRRYTRNRCLAISRSLVMNEGRPGGQVTGNRNLSSTVRFGVQAFIQGLYNVLQNGVQSHQAIFTMPGISGLE